jgi:3-methylcrotonyl-CoA carboxylase beta subunit
LYTLRSKIDVHTDEFKQNKAVFLGLMDTYYQRIRLVEAGGSQVAVARHKERGKLLVRERINMLVDPGTPFLELSAAAKP